MSEDASRPPGEGFMPPVSTFTGPIAELVGHGLLSPPSRPGLLATLDGYEVLRILGGGGMGVVLLARDSGTGRQVAIKMVRPELLADTQIVHRFLKEAGHLQKLRHANVIEVLEVRDREQGPYFVMPYFEQGNLARRIRPGQPMPAEAILEIATQIGEALEFAHRRGIIHRDLKPANILLTSDRKAVLADFGLARTVFNDTLVEVDKQECEGTAPYMSPGTAAGNAEDTRCDIYAFGALLYEMLTGEPPYKGRTTKETRELILAGPPRPVRELNPEADAGLVSVAEGAMGRELRERYADIADVLADLRRVQEGKPPLGPHGVARSLRDKMQRTGRFPAMIGVPACIVALALVGWLLWHLEKPKLARIPLPPVRTNLPPRVVAPSATPAGVTNNPPAAQPISPSNQVVSSSVSTALVANAKPGPGTGPKPEIVPATGAAPAWAAVPQPVRLEHFRVLLAPYGTWLEIPPYGWCWRPTAAIADANWRPYTQQGHWVYSDVGWFWHSDYSWGQIAFHYGRWFRDRGDWVWAPGYDWAPAWVCWREADGYLGWAPLPPTATFQTGVGLQFDGALAGDSPFGLGAEAFTFVAADRFWDHDLAAAALPSDKAAEVFKASTVKNGYRAVNGVFAVEGIGRERMASLTHHEVKVETPASPDLRPISHPESGKPGPTHIWETPKGR